MRNAIKIINGAVERIDYPLVVAGLIADDSLFAVQRVGGKLGDQKIGNELLALDVDRQLDVVSFGRVDATWQIKILTQEFAGSARCLLGGVQVMRHSKK